MAAEVVTIDPAACGNSRSRGEQRLSGRSDFVGYDRARLRPNVK
jgi:hypothetical protein